MSLIDKLEEISEYSEQVQEVLSHPPKSLLTNGTLVIVSIFLGMIGLSFVLRYPDMLKGSAMITTRNPPVKLHSRAAGRLTKLLVADTAFVTAGTPLAEIENTTRLENIPLLRNLIDQVQLFLRQPKSIVAFPTDTLTFGVLQEEYNTLARQYREYVRLLNDPYNAERIRLLETQLSDYRQLALVNQQQARLNAAGLKNSEISYRTNTRLYTDKVISRLEMLKSENDYLQARKEAEAFNKALIEIRLTITEKQRQIADLKHEQRQLRRQFEENLQRSIQTIRNALTTWQQTYLLTAPVAGRVRYLRTLNEKQDVSVNDTLFSIVPPGDQYIAVVHIPVQNMGKLRVGQAVRIKVDDFPYAEFGALRGEVAQLSPTAQLSLYRLTVRLPEGLRTSFQKQLPYKPEMTGSAEIITEDLRLAERLFYELRALGRQP